MRVDKSQLRFGLIIAGLVAAYAVGLWWPQARRINKLHADIAEAETQLGLTRGRTDGLSQLADQVDDLRRQVETNNKEIPRHAELATVLRDISLQIESMDLTGQGISTQPTIERTDYVALPVDLTFSGSSVSAFRFIDRIESMRRLTQVESMEVRKMPDQPDQVQAMVKLKTYFSQSENEGGRS